MITTQKLTQRYLILHPVGKGGQGLVYKAQDKRVNNRLVAIKQMSKINLTPQQVVEATEAFEQEAFLLADLFHPHLPRIYDYFKDEDTENCCLVMDFIDGKTLEEYLDNQGGKLPFQEVLDIGIQLCTVLDYLHNRQPQIIFRDLNPRNVMRTPNGHLYLIDFGIARLFKPGKARDTAALGSPGYAAPEQYGKKQTEPRSDLYGLGATLHQLLSGDNPADDPFSFAPLQFQNDPHLAPLENLIFQTVEMKIDKRPTSASIIMQELQRIDSLLSLPVRPKPVSPQPVPTPQPQPVNPPQPVVPIQPVLSAPEKAGTTIEIYRGRFPVILVTWSPDGKYIASRVMGSYYYTQLWEVGTGKLIADHTRNYSNSIDTFIWSPDGKYIATIATILYPNRTRILEVRDAITHKNMFKYEEYPLSIAWSPDGKYIAVENSKTVKILETATGRCKREYEEDHYGNKVFTWSPDGKYITSGISTHWKVREVDTGSLKFEYFPNMASHCITWSPDGKYLAATDFYNSTIGYQDHIYIWEIDISKKIVDYKGHTGRIFSSIAWSPNGKYIASGGEKGKVYVWDNTLQNIITEYKGHSTWVSSVAWSPDGRYIASGGSAEKIDGDNTIHVWVAPK